MSLVLWSLRISWHTSLPDLIVPSPSTITFSCDSLFRLEREIAASFVKHIVGTASFSAAIPPNDGSQGMSGGRRSLAPADQIGEGS
ncbi:hypothetical protein BC936DRAFT_149561 [Jimgerdemannia flammicorona]|uniref:Uncharacterized protein n=1 Tax=Jimgerdemannia flammicorona TaxID=994334 RepID=A0A433DK45_9FUNG|nr:hypothetical protein BC936DRAFT_149561 [Jimgerdemannia flammicorona]